MVSSSAESYYEAMPVNETPAVTASLCCSIAELLRG
jgi:phage gp36-like protein